MGDVVDRSGYFCAVVVHPFAGGAGVPGRNGGAAGHGGAGCARGAGGVQLQFGDCGGSVICGGGRSGSHRPAALGGETCTGTSEDLSPVTYAAHAAGGRYGFQTSFSCSIPLP